MDKFTRDYLMEQQIEAIENEIKANIRDTREDWYFDTRQKMHYAVQVGDDFESLFWRERADSILWPVLTHGQIDLD